MKRILSVLLVMSLIFSFSGCKKEEAEKTVVHSVNIEEFAKKGEIPECKYNLGMNLEELKQGIEKDFEETPHDEHDPAYFIEERKEGALVNAGLYMYYYDEYNEADGVKYIVSFDTAFGFKTGTVIKQVEEVLKQYKYIKEDFNEKNSFFILGSQGKVLRTEFGEYTLIFAFVDNGLSATAIYKTNDWK